MGAKIIEQGIMTERSMPDATLVLCLLIIRIFEFTGPAAFSAFDPNFVKLKSAKAFTVIFF